MFEYKGVSSISKGAGSKVVISRRCKGLVLMVKVGGANTMGVRM